MTVAAVSTLPAGATVQPGPGYLGFIWPTTAAQAGDYMLTFSASDGTTTVDTTVPITVGPITYPDLPMSTSWTSP